MVEAKTPIKAVKKTTPPRQGGTSKATIKASGALYAVFTTGGKQYRVKVGDMVKIEKLTGEYKEGDKINFDQVLLTDDGASHVTLGTPFIKDSVVKVTLNKINRYKTIDVIKYKQKSRYFKKYGHRQPYFEVKVDSIS